MDIKTLCLGVLSAGPHSGYEIKKTIERQFRHFFRASIGSIYPALADLERLDLLRCEEVVQDGRPDKKVYSITETGRRTLADRLAAENPRHTVRSEFLVLLYFAHLLEPKKLEQVIDLMTAEFERIRWQDLEAYERDDTNLTPGQKFALGYGRTMLSTALDYLKQEKAALLRDSGVKATERSEPTKLLSLVDGGGKP